MWGQFEKNKEALAKQYETDAYEDGISLDAQKALLAATHEKYKNEPMLVRKTHIFCELLSHARIEVRGDELFPDKIEHGNLIPLYALEYHLGVYERVERERGLKQGHPVGGVIGALDFGHLTPDWERLFALGFPGVLRELREAQAKDGGAHADYYKYGIMVYEAVIAFLHRFADLAEKKGTPASLFAAENLRALAAHEPRTLAQGMHLLFLYYEIEMHFDDARVRSLGPVDVLLGPLYEADLASGRFTEAQLRELTRYFLWQISAKHITANLPLSLGTSRRAADIAYSFLLLDEYEALRLYDPKIHILHRRGEGDALYMRALSLIRDGLSSFCFVSFETARDGFLALGVTPEDAERVGVVGCYEPYVLGKEIPCTCSGYLNFAKAVEQTVVAGAHYATFEDFMAAVCQSLRKMCDDFTDYITICEGYTMEIGPTPLLSATFLSSVERGVDVYDGGATYNTSSIIGSGIGTAADACLAVKTLVFDEGRVTLDELARILANNFEGEEKLRLYAAKRCPKYGCGDGDADAVAVRLFETMADAINGKKNGRGGFFRIGVTSVDYRFKLGKNTGASASARVRTICHLYTRGHFCPVYERDTGLCPLPHPPESA